MQGGTEYSPSRLYLAAELSTTGNEPVLCRYGRDMADNRAVMHSEFTLYILSSLLAKGLKTSSPLSILVQNHHRIAYDYERHRKTPCERRRLSSISSFRALAGYPDKARRLVLMGHPPVSVHKNTLLSRVRTAVSQAIDLSKDWPGTRANADAQILAAFEEEKSGVARVCEALEFRTPLSSWERKIPPHSRPSRSGRRGR
ncbi:hypothetical protein OE88DRAFT_1729059 [Heliocybe sulcata]|uniref:Uncharacterized protein n=1 Tax=Heliocybe sulcata TaxID=5364 RepID=A0A5C3MNF6_9AGAM|nr:hypothetical protein OE88DRAFT_1729059 [Heliocybe sulcata]